MNASLKNLIETLVLQDPQTFRHITVIPLTPRHPVSNGYVTLGEALNNNSITVTEISQAGAVPNLMVINRADKPVLLLDGEELVGAKQNRVLNTSILLKERSETVVPVSCTEHGRWSYSSPTFADADVVMSRKARSSKVRSVSESLLHCECPHSDQGEVWNEISELHAKAGTASPTGAMHDVYKARNEDLEACLRACPPLDGQTGLMVLVDGQVAGFDLLTQPHAYARLHSKLLKSYALDALVEPPTGKGSGAAECVAKARAFLARIAGADERSFPSAGYGTDFRYRQPGLAGAALVHEDAVIHTAFFQIPEVQAEDRDRIASLHQRRRRYVV